MMMVPLAIGLREQDAAAAKPSLTRQFGGLPIAPDGRQATFALNPALCFFRVRFMSCFCASGAF